MIHLVLMAALNRRAVPAALESIVLAPYYAFEQYVAARNIPKTPGGRRFDTLATHQQGAAVDHSLWDALLDAYVVNGRVDYDGLGNDKRFDQYVASLAAVDESKLAPLQELALYLNAYNALCIGHIVRGNPPNSILDLSSDVPIWDQPAGIVAGAQVSLNDIEHKLLRGRWDEPTLHACIVCASKSCPDLASFAFKGDDSLPQVMRERAVRWLADDTKGLKVEDDTTTLSRIFLWFENDFQGRHGGPRVFAERLTGSSLPSQLRYFDYDWSLNSC